MKIVDYTPKEVTKRKVCSECGVELEYVPIDVKRGSHLELDGHSSSYEYIICPNCGRRVTIWEC